MTSRRIKDGRTEALHGRVVPLGFRFGRPDPGGNPSQPTPPGSKEAYKLRQQPVEARGELTAPGSFLWRSRHHLKVWQCVAEG
jgi:hypothetical protein